MKVAAGPRLGHGNGDNAVARAGARQVALLLLLRAVVVDVGHRNVCRKGAGERGEKGASTATWRWLSDCIPEWMLKPGPMQLEYACSSHMTAALRRSPPGPEGKGGLGGLRKEAEVRPEGVSRAGKNVPPYSSGMQMPSSPFSPAAFHTSRETWPSSSHLERADGEGGEGREWRNGRGK